VGCRLKIVSSHMKKSIGEARPYYERALHIFMARLGPNHALTQTVQRNLAALDTLINQSQ